MPHVTPPRRRKWPASRASRHDQLRRGKQAMSTTNRAFIKAYRQDAAQPNAERPKAVRGSTVVRGSHDPAPSPTAGLPNQPTRRPALARNVASSEPHTAAGTHVRGAVERRPLSSYRTQPTEMEQ